MAKIDETYHKLLEKILTEGETYEDPNRKGVLRVQIPRFTLEHSFSDGFPALTSKKMFLRGVNEETLWVLRGDTNVRTLQDKGVHIWDQDYKNHVDRGNKDNGDLGRIYGYQLRSFGGKFDQLAWIVDTMRNNPRSTKKTVTYINPNDKEHQALTPCHTGFKVLVSGEGFYIQWEQDSVDTFLGLPFNIIFYANVGYFLGAVTGLKPLGIVGDLSNVHIYEPHLSAVRTQLGNDPKKYPPSTMSGWENMTNLSVDEALSRLDAKSFSLNNYKSYPPITAKMIPYTK